MWLDCFLGTREALVLFKNKFSCSISLTFNLGLVLSAENQYRFILYLYFYHNTSDT